MAIICWGSLAKSADDTQRIEEAIQDYIETHDMNPNAHMGEDYALGVHRLQAVLDHSRGSIDLGYMSRDKYLFMTAFETLDGWSMGDIFVKDEGIWATYLQTENINDELIEIWYGPYGYAMGADISKNPMWQTTAKISQDTNQIIYMAAGNPGDLSQHAMWGFKVVNEKTYICYESSGSEVTEEITGYPLKQVHIYRCEINSSDEKIQWYIDGVMVHEEIGLEMESNVDVIYEITVQAKSTQYTGIVLIDHFFTMDR